MYKHGGSEEEQGGRSEVRRVLKAWAFPEGRASVPLVATAVTTRERPALLGTEESQQQAPGAQTPAAGLGRAKMPTGSPFLKAFCCRARQKVRSLLPPRPHPRTSLRSPALGSLRGSHRHSALGPPGFLLLPPPRFHPLGP